MRDKGSNSNIGFNSSGIYSVIPVCQINIRRIFIAFLCLFWVCTSSALTFTVNTKVDTLDSNPGDGVCADAGGKCSLRAAIQEANQWSGPDVIELEEAFYQLTDGGLDIFTDLTILGEGRDDSIIDGGQLDRVFDIRSSADVTIQGVTIRNGRVGGFGEGGGIQVAQASLNISDCNIINNSANNGGGIAVTRFSSNNDFKVEVNNCTISNNNADSFGGGSFNKFGGVATIIDSLISNNNALWGGGVFYSDLASMTITGSTLSNNQAESGGGIGSNYFSGQVQINNSTISGNDASQGPGGLWSMNNQLSAVTVINNSTITDNSAGTSGQVGGISIDGTLVVSNSIIAGNFDPGDFALDCSGLLTSQGYNIIGVNTGCTFITSAGDVVGVTGSPVNPLLASLGDYGGSTPTHALLNGSPAINAGNPAIPGSGGNTCEAADQRGVLRVNEGICDVGAHESTGGADLWVLLSDNSNIDSGVVSHIAQLGNLGPNTAINLNLVIILTEGSENLNINNQGWNCTTSSSVVTCNKLSLNVSFEDELVIEYLPPADVNTLNTEVTIASTTFDPVTSNNFAQLVSQNSVVTDDSDDEDVESDEGASGISGVGNLYNQSEIKRLNNLGIQASDNTLEESFVAVNESKNDFIDEIDWAAFSTMKTKDLIKFDTKNRNYKSAIFSFSIGAILIAGVINLFLAALSYLGVFFTSPLLARFDPVPVVLVTKEERDRREKEKERANKAENEKIGKIIDND